jgi:hypothetical protein
MRVAWPEAVSLFHLQHLKVLLSLRSSHHLDNLIGHKDQDIDAGRCPALPAGAISIGQLKVTGTSSRRISRFHKLPDWPLAMLGMLRKSSNWLRQASLSRDAYVFRNKSDFFSSSSILPPA